MSNNNDKYLAFMGKAPKRIPHWEHWSCPDAETFITGMDYYDHPRLCRMKMAQLYPQLELRIPKTDQPIPRPVLGTGDESSSVDGQGMHRVRWGDGETNHWDWGKQFKSVDEVLAFSPLEQGDFTGIPVVEEHDFRDEEKLYQKYMKFINEEYGEDIGEGKPTMVGFYNTMFMWPVLTFGWELFLEACLEEGFERIMDEFAEINRRVFKVFARLPVNFILCHDDIVTSRGPVCSPSWMNKYIFPRYEELWDIVKKAGKEVIFMADGCMDRYADDVMACGARGIITEPYTDFKAIARRHKDCLLGGEGDNRVLMSGNREEIKKMVIEMRKTADMTGGYLMCVGNHIPWNLPPESVKLYLDLAHEIGVRE